MRKKNKNKGKENRFIKQPVSEIKVNEADIQRLSEIDYPLFSFKYLSDASFKKHGDLEFFREYLLRLKMYSNVSWNVINVSNKHSVGTELIKRSQIHPDLPKEITSDVNLIAFRSSGDNKAMVGFRLWNIFYIVFIEAQHNDIYDHS